MLIATANNAQAANPGAGLGMYIIMMVAVFGVMYFFTVRPQRKEDKRRQLMISEMAVGDAVVTTSGFYGIVIDITEDDVIVEFGNNKNCRIPMRKAAISAVEKSTDAQ